MLPVESLETPAVTVDLDIMDDNIRRVQSYVTKHGIAFRPHIKTHKIPALGKLQMQAGAVGITCQKIGEVEVFADAGVAEDVLLTFNIIGAQKTDRLMTQMKRLQRLAVVLDNEPVAKGLSEAAIRHGTHVRFLIECDTGMGRNRCADSAGRARSRPRRHAAAAHALRRPDDVPDPPAQVGRVLR